jgi:hypothetical protein
MKYRDIQHAAERRAQQDRRDGRDRPRMTPPVEDGACASARDYRLYMIEYRHAWALLDASDMYD